MDISTLILGGFVTCIVIQYAEIVWNAEEADASEWLEKMKDRFSFVDDEEDEDDEEEEIAPVRRTNNRTINRNSNPSRTMKPKSLHPLEGCSEVEEDEGDIPIILYSEKTDTPIRKQQKRVR